MIKGMPCGSGTRRTTAVDVYSYCIYTFYSITKTKYPFGLWASWLDVGAPPPLPFIPVDKWKKKDRLNKTAMEEEKNGCIVHCGRPSVPLVWEYGNKSPIELAQWFQLLSWSPADLCCGYRCCRSLLQTCIEFSAAPKLNYSNGQSCNILNAPPSLQLLPVPPENTPAETESTFQTSKGACEHLEVPRSTGKGYQNIGEICVWLPYQFTFCQCENLFIWWLVVVAMYKVEYNNLCCEMWNWLWAGDCRSRDDAVLPVCCTRCELMIMAWRNG